jgi:alkanesulfonate monooxygenase SsuD/methylene tetrahydromethanopterin reductase-like flavin-dependent oxidoreductase (luciferase family)
MAPSPSGFLAAVAQRTKRLRFGPMVYVSPLYHPRWHESFTYLSSRLGIAHRHARPPEFDAIAEDRRAFAGTPEEVAEYVRSQTSESGANYFVGQFAFGDLTREETLRSIELFSDEVMTMSERAPA